MFFYFISRFEQKELLDLLLKRYGNIEYIMSMEIEEAIDLIEYAIKQEAEDKLFQRWVHEMQFQMSFNEFKEKLKPVIVKDETEIIAEVKDILAMFEG